MTYDRTQATKQALFDAALDGFQRAIALMEEDGSKMRVEIMHMTGAEPIIRVSRQPAPITAKPPPVPDNLHPIKEGA